MIQKGFEVFIIIFVYILEGYFGSNLHLNDESMTIDKIYHNLSSIRSGYFSHHDLSKKEKP